MRPCKILHTLQITYTFEYYHRIREKKMKIYKNNKLQISKKSDSSRKMDLDTVSLKFKNLPPPLTNPY